MAERLIEYSYELDTLDGTSSQVETESFVGYLDGLQMQTNRQVEVTITTHDGLQLYYNDAFIKDIDYVALRIQPRTCNDERLPIEAEKYLLNDKLIIKIAGPKETKFNIKIRGKGY